VVAYSSAENGLHFRQIIPEKLDITRRTDEAVFSKFIKTVQALGLFLLPQSETDIKPYNDVIQYLKSRKKVGIVQLHEGSSLYLSITDEGIPQNITYSECIVGHVVPPQPNPTPNLNPNPNPSPSLNPGPNLAAAAQPALFSGLSVPAQIPLPPLFGMPAGAPPFPMAFPPGLPNMYMMMLMQQQMQQQQLQQQPQPQLQPPSQPSQQQTPQPQLFSPVGSLPPIHPQMQQQFMQQLQLQQLLQQQLLQQQQPPPQ